MCALTRICTDSLGTKTNDIALFDKEADRRCIRTRGMGAIRSQIDIFGAAAA